LALRKDKEDYDLAIADYARMIRIEPRWYRLQRSAWRSKETEVIVTQ